jgi:nitrous-oxide reductase
VEYRRWQGGAGAGLALALLTATGIWLASPSGAQESGTIREFTLQARKYAFTPSVIDVRQDDLVRVTLRAEDIPHSFTVDAYRIAKRAAAGQTVTFEFRADRPGTFPFYCNLKIDDGCREMRGQLIVRPR